MFGQKKTILENFLLMTPILLAGISSFLLVAFKTFERSSYAVLTIGLIGLLFIIFAKWPLLKVGKFMTFGPNSINRKQRVHYFIGYLLLGICVSGAMLIFANL